MPKLKIELYEKFSTENQVLLGESDDIEVLQYLIKPNYEFNLQNKLKLIDNKEVLINYKLIFARK